MGRASNRKKAQRQAGPSSRQARADAATQRAMHLLVSGLQALVQEGKEREEREAAARWVWSGGAEAIPAQVPPWREDSLGDRFSGGTHLAEARDVPCLATAQIPDAAVITADSAHWNAAASALIRAVAFDCLGLDHPAVRTLLEVLAPIAEAELAYYRVANASPDWDEDFPELDGPVFLLGACALVDVMWAAVGEDPLTEVLGVLVPGPPPPLPWMRAPDAVQQSDLGP